MAHLFHPRVAAVRMAAASDARSATRGRVSACSRMPGPGWLAGALTASSARRLGGLVDQFRDDLPVTEHGATGRGRHFDDLRKSARLYIHRSCRGRDHLVTPGDQAPTTGSCATRRPEWNR